MTRGKYHLLALGAIRTCVSTWYIAKRYCERWKPSLFVYTDSRGFRIDNWWSRRNPIGAYVSMLAQQYRLTYHICPYRHTTLLDFLFDVHQNDMARYDAIILHVGIVDFSPRPISQAAAVLKEKAHKIRAVFGDKASEFEPYLHKDVYDGEPTASLYSPQVLTDLILPEIKKLKSRLVWIGINNIVLEWRGNYHRDRPRNMNVVGEFQARVEFGRGYEVLSLSHWSEQQIRQFTVDNIHLSRVGNEYLFGELSVRLLNRSV